jgi:hypothetical protein
MNLRHTATAATLLTASVLGLGATLTAPTASAASTTGTPAVAAAHPDTCKNGYVWRDARPGDHVCVTPYRRDVTAYENSQAANRIAAYGGNYGSTTCKQGYVWREAYSGDHVCVTPASRDQNAYDNSQAANRRLYG